MTIENPNNQEFIEQFENEQNNSLLNGGNETEEAEPQLSEQEEKIANFVMGIMDSIEESLSRAVFELQAKDYFLLNEKTGKKEYKPEIHRKMHQVIKQNFYKMCDEQIKAEQAQ